MIPNAMGTYVEACRAVPKPQRLMIFALAGAVFLANIKQPYPSIAPLQHIPTVLLIVAAPILIDRFPLSNRSAAALVSFLLLHTLAGRYTYSNVPYDGWARALTGCSISDLLSLQRNGFDRVVHFASGCSGCRRLRSWWSVTSVSDGEQVCGWLSCSLAHSVPPTRYSSGCLPWSSRREWLPSITANKATRGMLRRTWPSPS